MNVRLNKLVTVVSLMAVTFILVVISGCVTKRDIEEVKRQLTTVESQNRNTQEMVARMDSIIASGAAADNQLRNEMRTAQDDLGRQINQLLENFHDLQQQIDRLTRDQVIMLPPKSSPGAQMDPPLRADTLLAAPSSLALDSTCINAYDSAFTLVTRLNYEAGLAAFEEYFDTCEGDGNLANAHYWSGECYFSLAQYAQATAEFETVTERFPESPKLRSALYKRARCAQELDEITKAKELFQRIIAEHPGTLEARNAGNLLAEMK